MAASSSSNAIGSTWYTLIDLDRWFPSISAIRQAALEIGGVVSPKKGLVVGRDVVLISSHLIHGGLGRENTKDSRLDEVCY